MTLTTSQSGIDLIKAYETKRLDAHDVEGNGKLTIGYGHYNDPDISLGMVITEAQAENYLRQDLRAAEAIVNSSFTRAVPLTQNQFDALVSWTFNTGAGSGDSVWTKLNSGDYLGAMNELAGWRSAVMDGERVVVRGLVARRNDEIARFVGGDSERDYDYEDRYGNDAAMTSFWTDLIKDGINEGTVKLEDVYNILFNFSDVGGLQRIYLNALKASEKSCFLAGTLVTLPDGTNAPIESILPGDIVLSYNANGTLVPGRVTRTFQNEVSHILDVHGLKVTPGHATLCGAGMFKGRHVPIIDILLSDGALVQADGALIRMAINAPVGSVADAFVKLAVAATPEDMQTNTLAEAEIRVGTLLFDRDGAPVSVLDCLTAEGYAFDPATGLIAKAGEAPHPLFWFGRVPQPEDYILKRSQETLEGILTDGEWEGSRSELIAGRLRQTSRMRVN